MSMIIYIGIKALVFSSILAGVYFLLLRRTTLYTFNRIYLLFSLPVSILLACIQWPGLPGVHIIPAHVLPVAEITGSQGSSLPGSFFIPVWAWLYATGSLVMLVLLMMRLLSGLRFLKKYPGRQQDHYVLHLLPETYSPGSFFHHIMMPEKMEEDIFSLTLTHEKAHVKHLHSVDKLWMELSGTLLYYNPFYWLIKKELYALHELQADQEVLKQYPAKVYKTMILASALHTRPVYIYQAFSSSNLKTRFIMMNKTKNSRWSAVRSLLVFPPLVAAALAFTLPSSQWAKLSPFPGRHTVLPAEDDIVYPEFQGGQTAMFEFMGQHVKYPDEAKKKKIEGKVFVSFMVLKDGSITQVALKKGIHESIDNEAIRVVKSMPAWKPGTKNGEPADFEMVLPVNFKLE